MKRLVFVAHQAALAVWRRRKDCLLRSLQAAISGAAVLILVGLADRERSISAASFLSLGADLVVVRADPVLGHVPVKPLKALDDASPSLVWAGRSAIVPVEVTSLGVTVQASLTRTTGDYLSANRWHLLMGRRLGMLDQGRADRAMVSAKLATRLGAIPGDIVSTSMGPVVVVGVYESVASSHSSGDSTSSALLDSGLLLPIRTEPSDHLYHLVEAVVRYPGISGITTARAVRRAYDSWERDDPTKLEFIVPAELAAAATATRNRFDWMVAAVAAVGSIVCVVSISQAAMADARARADEFLLRRCYGASRNDVLFQLLIENASIGCCGATLAIALSLTVHIFIGFGGDRSIVIDPHLVIAVYLSTIIIAIVGAISPAYWAARQDDML